ncbi:hypothetical protein ACWDUG_09705 [Streptomyces cellulosae]|uniref:hypothetical protein n=1 Tax=Streptomyces sp. McG8 TaxID=2725487 RepID=UPI001BE7FF3C|nr:hypothetical protein [Streptomyces sp. McG8]
MTRGPQLSGTVGATVVDGTATDGFVSNSREVNGARPPETGRLTGAPTRCGSPAPSSGSSAAPACPSTG